MNYKGYIARIEFDERDDIFIGRVLGLNAKISFHGKTIGQLHTAFKEAVGDFFLACKEQGPTPKKSAIEQSL